MILAALVLIALLTLALAASVAFIAHDLAVEQRSRPEQSNSRIPVAA